MDDSPARICPRCRETLPLSAFSKNRASKSGLAVYCKACCKTYKKRYALPALGSEGERLHPARRNASLRKKYGISLGEYRALLIKQNGACAICGQPERYQRRGGAGPQALCVDHDHETGQVRGLLCRACNAAIGLLDHSPMLLSKAIDYLYSHS